MSLHLFDSRPSELQFRPATSVPSRRAYEPHQAEPTVFIIDRDVSVRKSLELLVASEGWRSESSSAPETFVSPARGTAPRCLLLDLGPAGTTGPEFRRLLNDRQDTPIIFITGHGDVASSVRAMKAGAFDFLTKPLQTDVILESIRGALDRSRAALAEQGEMQDLHAHYATLTRREREVMDLVVSGLLNKQVAGELGISEITVKAHRGQVMRKMAATSLPHLVRMAGRLPARMEGGSRREGSSIPSSNRTDAVRLV